MRLKLGSPSECEQWGNVLQVSLAAARGEGDEDGGAERSGTEQADAGQAARGQEQAGSEGD